MFNLSDGRKSLYQWDLNRQVTVYDETITEVHFANEKSTDALVTEVRNGKADIPNILLQENVKYLYVYGVDINFTKHFEKFPIVSRAKPSDYIYTETEVKALENFTERLDYLEMNGIGSSQIEEKLDSIKVYAEDASNYSQSTYSSLNGIGTTVNNIDTTVNNIDTNLSNLHTKVDTAKTGISNNNTLITQNKNSLESLHTKVDSLNNNMTANTTAVNGVNTNVANQAASLTEIQSSIEEVKNLILAIDTGGGSGGSGEECERLHLEVPDYVYNLTGNMSSRFLENKDIWLVEQTPDSFYGNPTKIDYFFKSSSKLKAVPSFENVDFSNVRGNSLKFLFYGCYTLVEIPEDFLKKIPINDEYCWNGLDSTFEGCYLLKSIKGITFKEGFYNNPGRKMFKDTFYNTYSLENLEFAYKANNQPQTVNFTTAVLDLTTCVGYASSDSGVFNDNNIPVVTNDSEYEALKNSDYGARSAEYSHYNHNSAVRTINSLPHNLDTDGTNTIKFKGISGSNTDGGAINTLTDEEIAVATEKGWTVSYV